MMIVLGFILLTFSTLVTCVASEGNSADREFAGFVGFFTVIGWIWLFVELFDTLMPTLKIVEVI